VVRRAAVHLAEAGSLPSWLEEALRASDDPLLKKAYAGFPGQSAWPFNHLVHHSDCEGYYVPADFGQVIVDERLAARLFQEPPGRAQAFAGLSSA
jgi:hypothetical protein